MNNLLTVDGYLARYLDIASGSYYRHVFDSVCKLIDTPSPGIHAAALDYGCGGGMMSSYLALKGYKVTACDIDPVHLEACRLNLAQRCPGIEVNLVQNCQNDFWHGLADKYDLIVLKDVVEHINDDSEFVKLAAKHLNLHGHVIIVTQNNESWNYLYESPGMLAENPAWCGWDPDHKKFYNMKTLAVLLENAGLRPIVWRSNYFVPYKAFNGLLGRKFRSFMRKARLEDLFYIPDIFLGASRRLQRFGWSLQVKAGHVQISSSER